MRSSQSAECTEGLLSSLRAGLDIFSCLDDAEWAAAAPTLRTEHYVHGQEICAKGDAADAMFVIWQGHIDIADGTHLQSRGRGEIVGEQALIEGGRRGAAMRARGDVQLILVPQSTLEQLVGRTPFGRSLLRALSAKLTQATADRARRFAREEHLIAEFRAHVSSAVLNEMLTNKEYGRPRIIQGVVLLSDIRDFSSHAAHLSPLEVAEQLGSYLSHAASVIHQHGGLVDKFIGDAVLAIWGWPQERGDQDVTDAFRCAKALIETARDFTFGGAPVRVAVGLDAGPIFIGNIGSNEKRQFTVLGEIVNLAARFEAMSKNLRVPLVVSGAVRGRLPVDVQAQFATFDNQAPKGSARQTVYGWDARVCASGAAEGEEAS